VEQAENRVEWSGERALQKNDGEEQNVERKVTDQGLQKQVGARSGFFATHAPLTCSFRTPLSVA